jgi:hypothetical protein
VSEREGEGGGGGGDTWHTLCLRCVVVHHCVYECVPFCRLHYFDHYMATVLFSDIYIILIFTCVMQVQSGALCLEAYLSRIRSRLESDKKLAVFLSQAGDKQSAVLVMKRVRIMTAKINGAEEAMASTGS